MIKGQEIELKYVKSEDNVADIFTKSLRGSSLGKHRTSLGLRTIGACET